MSDMSPESRISRETIWSFPYIALMAVNFFQSMAAFMTTTTLPVYMNALGANATMVGIIVSAAFLAALLIRPIAGPAFDSFSRKRLLILAQSIICICMFSYGIVTSMELIIVVRLFHGIGIGCSGPLAMSLVSEFLPASRFASGISIYALAQSMAQVIGPAIGLYIADSIGFSYSYFLSGGLLLIAIIGVTFIKESYREHLPYKLRLNRMFAPEALSEGFALMLLSISFSCMTSYVVLYGMLRGMESMGFYFIIYAICLVFNRPLFGKLADRFGAPKILIVGIIFFAISYFALYNATDLIGFAIAAVISSAGFGCCAPLIQSMALASVPVSRRGAASNTSFTGLDLGNLIGPTLGGGAIEMMIQVLGSEAAAYSHMWLIMLIPAICTLFIAAYWIRSYKKNEKHDRSDS